MSIQNIIGCAMAVAGFAGTTIFFIRMSSVKIVIISYGIAASFFGFVLLTLYLITFRAV